ncbi:MAG: prolyl oligopeptidase family serine peptidase [Actinomycetota bacterium]
MVRPVPLELLTSGRDLSEPRLAPIGRPQVAFVQRVGGAASINAVWLDGPRHERILTFGPQPAPGRGLGGGCFTWIARGDELSIAYITSDGDLVWQLGATLVVLTPPPAADRAGTDPIASPAPRRTCRAPAVDGAGATLVVAVDEAEVWLVDLDAVAAGAALASTARRLDDGRHDFCFDPSISPNGDTVSWQAWSPPDMPWDGSVRVDHRLESGRTEFHQYVDAAVQQPRFSVVGAPVQVDDRRGWLNVSDTERAVVSEDVEHAGPSWGMGARTYAFGPGGRRVAIARNVDGFGDLVIDDLERGDRRTLGRGVYGHLDWVGDHVAAIRTGARTPPQVVVHDPRSGDRTVLATSGVEAWPLDELPEPELVRHDVDEHVILHARRFRADRGRMLVWVHGGPTDQWRVDWRPRITYWWSRGWDVLVVDPRGTTGHGRRHQQALHGGWGRIDVDDVAALIGRAHGAGWASPTTTVVIGGSSGGLTVLGVLADHPELVAGGVASYPVSDLKALTEVTHRFEAHYTDTLVAPNDGSDRSEAMFTALSPINRAERIAAPLLIFHGTDDPVVPIAQSRDLIDRLRSTRPAADAELVEYDGEGHGFRDPVHVADEYERTERFLARVVVTT